PARAGPKRFSAVHWAATRSSQARSTGTAERRLSGERPLHLPRALLGGGYAVLLDGDLHLQRLRDGWPRGGVDHALGTSDGDVGVGEQLIDQGLRRLLQLLGLDDAV